MRAMTRSRCPLNNILRFPPVLMALRVALAGIFIYASWEKILKPDDFARIVDGYRILPQPMVSLVAILLPWTELIAGVALLVGIWPRAIGLLFSGLTAVFILGLIQALARGIDFHCGCFSLDPEGATRTWTSLWQEFLLLAGCLWLWIGHWQKVPEAGPDEEGTVNG